jgi:hypothetical protein
MATVKISYGTATALTITLNSLASAGTATSSAVVNTTDLALDALVDVEVTTASGTLGTNPNVAVYALGSVDGTNFADSTNATLIGVIPVAVAATAYRKTNMSIANAFGGSVPPQWKLYVVNNTGLALGSSGNAAQYVETQATVA